VQALVQNLSGNREVHGTRRPQGHHGVSNSMSKISSGFNQNSRGFLNHSTSDMKHSTNYSHYARDVLDEGIVL
jgi:hypothetical protein